MSFIEDDDVSLQLNSVSSAGLNHKGSHITDRHYTLEWQSMIRYMEESQSLDNKLQWQGINTLKPQVVSLQTAHSWANAGVLLGDACIGSGVAFEAI